MYHLSGYKYNTFCKFHDFKAFRKEMKWNKALTVTDNMNYEKHWLCLTICCERGFNI